MYMVMRMSSTGGALSAHIPHVFDTLDEARTAARELVQDYAPTLVVSLTHEVSYKIEKTLTETYYDPHGNPV